MVQQLRIRILLLFLSSLLTACNRPSEGPPAPPPVRNYFRTHFQDESQFIVETILTDLAEMTAYARSNQIPPELLVTASEQSDSQFRQPNYDLKITAAGKETLNQTLQVRGPIWSPELYAGPTKTLLGTVSPPRQLHDVNDLSVLLALTDLRPAVIEAENRRISALLQTNFTDPTLHEMAAVILGAFALRESSGCFYDVRLPLCRMTAHLTLARALSGGSSYGVNGRMAEAMLFTLMHNETTALEKLKTLESEPKLKPWVEALRAWNTYDYRELQARKGLSRLEWIAYYSAVSQCINAGAGWTRLPPELIKTSSDFSRIAYGQGRSVGLGHELFESSLVLEFAEIGLIHSDFSPADPSLEELIKFLNLTPERCFTTATNQVCIIGPGQWGMFLQRHLCHVLQGSFNFLQRLWGVPEEAKKFADESDRKYGGLRLYPFVQRFNCRNEKEYHDAVDRGQVVMMATPQLVSPEIWNYLATAPYFSSFYWPHSHPHANEWHKHNPPPGTAYDLKPRRYHPSLVDRSDVAQIFGELHDLSPYDELISAQLLKSRHVGQESYAQAEEVYRPGLDYDAIANRDLATYAIADPVKYEEIMLRYARLNPIGYFTLGRYFADRQQDEKAAAYYEKGVELHTDPVVMANDCGWLVRYYFKKGERAKAEALADQAAEVYSRGGLHAKAELMELEENYDEAVKYFLRMEERYNESGPVVGFCVRYKAKTADSRFDKLVQARLKTLFPRGLEKVGLNQFQSPPAEGILISQGGDLLQQAGMKKGDIIVALDGLRVYDMTQYQYVRGLTNGPLRLIVWNGSEYAEKNANPPKRLFGVPFADYHQPSKK